MNPITMQLVADEYIRMALKEDINSEDVSTNAVMSEYRKGEVQLLAKADGIIARKQGLVTDFGKLMDPLSDKSLVLAAYLVFVNMGWHTELVIMLMMAREFLVAGIRMAAASEGEVIAANKFGKAKTFLQMSTTGLTYLLLAIGEGAADITTSTPWLNVYCTIAFWVVAVVTVLSGIVYAKDGWHLIRTK